MELKEIADFLEWPPGAMTQLKKDDFAYRVIELVALAEKQEREACAKECDLVSKLRPLSVVADQCAEMIRARTP